MLYGRRTFLHDPNLRAAANGEPVLASTGDVILHCAKKDSGQ